MSVPPGAVPQASSQELEKYKGYLEQRRQAHEQIIAAYAEIADGLNGLASVLLPAISKLGGDVGDNTTIIADAISKILQSLTVLEQQSAEAMEDQIRLAEQAISAAKVQESGIVTPPRGTKVPRSN